jgi:hypothetical protein
MEPNTNPTSDIHKMHVESLLRLVREVLRGGNANTRAMQRACPGWTREARALVAAIDEAARIPSHDEYFDRINRNRRVPVKPLGVYTHRADGAYDPGENGGAP